MAKFVMMSMVFTVVLLKSAAFPIPKVIPKVVQVGDDIGWAVPKEGDKAFYENWVATKQFYVGDTVTFKSSLDRNVYRVTKAAYKACDKSNAIQELITDANGLATFNLNSTGDYYFISPDSKDCSDGMRLAISVLDLPPATPPVSSSPAVSVGFLVPMMAVVMGFFF